MAEQSKGEPQRNLATDWMGQRSNSEYLALDELNSPSAMPIEGGYR